MWRFKLEYKYIVAVGIFIHFLVHLLQSMYTYNSNLHTVSICDVRTCDRFYGLGWIPYRPHPVPLSRTYDYSCIQKILLICGFLKIISNTLFIVKKNQNQLYLWDNLFISFKTIKMFYCCFTRFGSSMIFSGRLSEIFQIFQIKNYPKQNFTVVEIYSRKRNFQFDYRREDIKNLHS